MQTLVPIALFGWLLVVPFFFIVMPPRRAVITAFVIGWLFLPAAVFKTDGLPPYSKETATGLAVFLSVLIFDSGRLLRFRPSLLDLPMLMWSIVCPSISAFTNGMGSHGALSESTAVIANWGLPYFIGRLYFTDLESLYDLAYGIFIGGLIYVPFCLVEIRLTPVFTEWVYGRNLGGDFRRLGGVRPVVFLTNGLILGLWMTVSSLVGVWICISKSVRRVRGFSSLWAAVALLITTVLCRSTGALLLLGVGLGTLFSIRRFRTTWPLIIVIGLVPTYLALRIADQWTPETLAAWVEDAFDKDRAASMMGRVDNEILLIQHAMEKPWFGWSGWDRSAEMSIGDPSSRVIQDSYWIIALGTTGLWGLATFVTTQLLAPTVLALRLPAEHWGRPAYAPLAALTLLVTLYMYDNLANAMIDPILILATGGVTSVAAALRIPLNSGSSGGRNGRGKLRPRTRIRAGLDHGSSPVCKRADVLPTEGFGRDRIDGNAL